MVRTPQDEIQAAIDHILWCVQWQEPGYVPLTVLRSSQGQPAISTRSWFDNRDEHLADQLRAFLNKFASKPVELLYSPGAFSRRQAKAQYALPSRIAFVDADEGGGTG